MTEDDTLSNLTAEYLESLEYLNRPDIQPSSNNCSVFRLKLYILRERLFTYIKETFQNFIRDLPENDASSIKELIEAKVRTLDPAGNSLGGNANLRKLRIGELDVTQFFDWSAFAACYTGRFLSWKHPQKTLKVDRADPKDLLEILKYCTLFDDAFYRRAYAAIRHRNKFYAHLDVLLIDSATLNDITYPNQIVTLVL